MLAVSATAPNGDRYVMNPQGRWLMVDGTLVVEMRTGWSPPIEWGRGTEVVLTLKPEEMADFAKRSGYPLGEGNAIDLDWVTDEQMQHLGQLGDNKMVVATLVRYWRKRYVSTATQWAASNVAKLNSILSLLEAETHHATDRDTVLKVQLESQGTQTGRYPTLADLDDDPRELTLEALERALRGLQGIPYQAPPAFGPRLGGFSAPGGPVYGPALGAGLR